MLWQFNYDAKLDVPYFHPLGTDRGQVLTWDSPPDHAWHHGLWFCWKYINGVNYWEHDRQTGKPAGRTQTTDVQVDTRDDHSARISLTLAYDPAGEDEVVLRERRQIDISAPNSARRIPIRLDCRIHGGRAQGELDRTPPRTSPGAAMRGCRFVLPRR